MFGRIECLFHAREHKISSDKHTKFSSLFFQDLDIKFPMRKYIDPSKSNYLLIILEPQPNMKLHIKCTYIPPIPSNQTYSKDCQPQRKGKMVIGNTKKGTRVKSSIRSSMSNLKVVRSICIHANQLMSTHLMNT